LKIIIEKQVYIRKEQPHMARRKTITREQILEASYELVSVDGFAHFTARNIANKIGCSTQPIYLEFKNMGELKDEIEKQNFISMCTPFDEPSVDKMKELNFQIFKVASCSFGDWPLMEKFSEVDAPVILSTACAPTPLLDSVISFFNNRKKDISIMHCVSSYPTENKDLEINQIQFLKNVFYDMIKRSIQKRRITQ
jgi:sialic acid synthase SpsE